MSTNTFELEAQLIEKIVEKRKNIMTHAEEKTKKIMASAKEEVEKINAESERQVFFRSLLIVLRFFLMYVRSYRSSAPS
ncbi:hypothetical protein ES703_71113 [subsurface metagenome]